jgi:4-amino-4-deoxy-L-arabinose transferase-like glycosyltransferase
MADFLKRHFSHVALGVILALYLLFGLQHLTQFITADEHYWVYERIPQYWEALAEGKWNKTSINDKPGVTLALVSGSGLLVTPDPEALCTKTSEQIITCDTVQAERTLLAFRLPILFLNALLILYLFWIIRKIANTQIALWSACFIALSPILLGISQIINPDALLWSFGSAALFSYFAALRFPEKKYIALSGVFLGFALLSKYTGSVLIPFFLLASLLSALFTERAASPLHTLERITKNLNVFFFTLLLAIAVIMFFLPAIWTKPALLQGLLSGSSAAPLILFPLIFSVLFLLDTRALNGRGFFLLQTVFQKLRTLRYLPHLLPWGIFLFLLLLAIGRILFPDWNLFTVVPFDIKDLTSTHNGRDVEPNIFEMLLLQINPLLFSLPPITLLFFCTVLLRMPFIQKKYTAWHFEILMTLLLLPLFISLLIFSDVLATPRYAILLYPLLAFLAACGIWEGRLYAEKKWPASRLSAYLKDTSVIVFIIVCSLFSLLASQPFYFNYTNPLLPKQSLISDAWGYGGYEAAQYLNALPNAENLLVWTDYEGVCEFFKGKCMVRQYKYSNKQAIDYAVITRRGKILYKPDHSRWAKAGNISMKEVYDNPNPDWALAIDDRTENFIKVVKLAK